MMRITVIGCGRVGAGLAGQLSLDGHDVTVADIDPTAFGRLAPGFSGRTVAGSGLDRPTLVTAGVESADAFAAVTGSDESNAVMARLAATRFRVPRVVARMYDPRQADLYRRLGILTISPVAWGIGRLSELLALKDVATVVTLGGGQVDLTEVFVPPALDGRPSSELEVAGEIGVAAITRGGRTFIPDPQALLHAGDVVYVVATAGAGERLQALLGGG
jgi:trk system potassium uptake protein TrkA